MIDYLCPNFGRRWPIGRRAVCPPPRYFLVSPSSLLPPILSIVAQVCMHITSYLVLSIQPSGPLSKEPWLVERHFLFNSTPKKPLGFPLCCHSSKVMAAMEKDWPDPTSSCPPHLLRLNGWLNGFTSYIRFLNFTYIYCSACITNKVVQITRPLHILYR